MGGEPEFSRGDGSLWERGKVVEADLDLQLRGAIWLPLACVVFHMHTQKHTCLKQTSQPDRPSRRRLRAEPER